MLARRAGRAEPGTRTAIDVLENELGWDAVIDAALRDEELGAAALDLDVGLAELRCDLSLADAAAAMGVELGDLCAAGAAGDDRGAMLARAKTALSAHVEARLRLAIERRTEYAYALNLAVGDADALAKQAVELRLEVTSQLRETCASIGGGSVGIVGPSGSGKTWLVKRFCEPARHPDPAVLSTVVRAGAPCDKLDFVKQVLARLCEEVLDGVPPDDDATLDERRLRSRRSEDRAKTHWRRFGAVLSWGGASLIVIGAFDVRTDPLLIAGSICLILAAAISRMGSAATASDSALRVVFARMLRKSGEQLPLIAVGALLIGASQLGTTVDLRVVVGAISLAIASTMRGTPQLLKRLVSTRRDARVPPARSPDLIETARAIRDQLEHEKTVMAMETRSRDGRLGRRFSLRRGTSSRISVTRAQRAWTFPDAVRRLELFVSEDAKDLSIWIGIDLQRMGPDKSQAFLEEIDDVLRLDRKGCFVLVSVLGEDALVPTVSERCDRVIQLGPLGFPDARGLLGHDGLGLSMPFAALCHVLSGGVTGSLVEHAQALARSKPADRDGQMSDLARALVTAQLQRHASHVHAKVLSDGTAGSSDVLEWTRDVRSRCGSAEDLLALHARRTARAPADASPSDPPAQAPSCDRGIEWLADGLAAHCYFAATVLAFFHDAMSREAVDRALKGERPPLEILREARSVLSVNPVYASSLVSSFRTLCELDPAGL